MTPSRVERPFREIMEIKLDQIRELGNQQRYVLKRGSAAILCTWDGAILLSEG